jgi:hypothetical protein
MSYYKCQSSNKYHSKSCIYVNKCAEQISYDTVEIQRLIPCEFCKPYICIAISVKRIIELLKKYNIEEQYFTTYVNYKLVKIDKQIDLYDNDNDIIMDKSSVNSQLVQLINLFLSEN